jgi:hypothetical protein
LVFRSGKNWDLNAGKADFYKKKGILFRFLLVIFPQDVTLSSFTQDLMKVLHVLV